LTYISLSETSWRRFTGGVELVLTSLPEEGTSFCYQFNQRSVHRPSQRVCWDHRCLSER